MANIDDYVTGVFNLAYHAAWSSVTDLMTSDSANATWRKAAPMARAVVEKKKMYAWLGMQLCVTFATLLVYDALYFPSVKFVRDTTLAPLRLDFASIAYHRLSKGLFSATALSKEDHKLPMGRFHESAEKSADNADDRASSDVCRRRLVFVDKSGHEMQ
ncbi:hypothetical protein P171DRAFT_487909 [Karstenula rhodostoma CBS 690.94]|uniref:Uncharacterized protein n=1 Tax=Karstenula rhodostoma CBS 690.94 TaxID=1392251 RepID=A0A9P4PCQ1_9PLEO|nr:hypothetical protein P171DRAFT_487909 [Karstenula rhodostoma CBS 690.94]